MHDATPFSICDTNIKLQAQGNAHGHNLNDRIYEASDQFSINKLHLTHTRRETDMGNS